MGYERSLPSQKDLFFQRTEAYAGDKLSSTLIIKSELDGLGILDYSYWKSIIHRKDNHQHDTIPTHNMMY